MKWKCLTRIVVRFSILLFYIVHKSLKTFYFVINTCEFAHTNSHTQTNRFSNELLWANVWNRKINDSVLTNSNLEHLKLGGMANVIEKRSEIWSRELRNS